MPRVYHYNMSRAVHKALSTASQSIYLINSIRFLNDLCNFSRITLKTIGFQFLFRPSPRVMIMYLHGESLDMRYEPSSRMLRVWCSLSSLLAGYNTGWQLQGFYFYGSCLWEESLEVAKIREINSTSYVG